MVKLMRKCRGADELAVLEVSHVGVITRARTRKLAMAEAKRKTPSEDLLQHKTRRKITTTPEKPENFVGGIDSRCCSKGSSELVDNVSLRSVIDLEDSHDVVIQNSPYRESELHPESNSNMDTAARIEETSSCEKPTAKMEMPTDEELESFFTRAETELKKQFSDKYNYDVEQDVPLEEGRYEWIQLKPRHED